MIQAAIFTPTITTDPPVSNIVNTATGVITSGPGSGQVSLRSAVIAANANPNSTINIPAGTYTLTIAGDDGSVDPNPTIGDLDVLASVTIKGAGPGSTIIQASTTPGSGIDQIFTLNAFFWSKGQSAVVNGYSATISGITFRYGKCLSVDLQSGSFLGGAISYDAGYNNGAAVTTVGSLSISNCVFDSNSSQYGGGAVATFDGGNVTIDSCTFTNNGFTATGNSSSGGAIFLGTTTVQGGPTIIKNSTFVHNLATSAGGALSFLGGTPTCQVHNCVFAQNTCSGNGGAIWAAGTFTVDQGTIISNNVSAGTGNGAAEGGGIYLINGPTVSNCTIVSNVCSLTSAAQRGGGGIAVGAGPVIISNCRIFGNIASSGSGLHKDLESGAATASNNWWGNNGGPGVGGADTAVLGGAGGSTGTLVSNPWLVMAFTAAPTTLKTGGTSALTASITKNSSGATGFTVPNGTPVTFSGILGSASPSPTIFAAGSASSTFTAGATGGTGSASATVDSQTLSASLTINQPPTVTSANNTAFTVGSAGAFTITATGVPTANLSVSGNFPAGVGFDVPSSRILGTPGAGTGGTYPLVITATNIVGTNTQSFTLTVNQPPAFTNASSTAFLAGTTGSFKIGGSGFPAPSISESNSDVLPSGVSFNAATGILGGQAAAGSGGIYTLHFVAHNGGGSDATQTFTLTINEAPTVTCPSDILTNAIGGVCFPPTVTFASQVTGFPTPGIVYKLGGTSLSSPVKFPLGTNTVNVTVTNAVGTNTCGFTVTVLPSAAPLLSVTQVDSQVVLSWPSNCDCYTLQTASMLNSNAWQDSTVSRFTNNTSVVVTNSIFDTNVFFRLSH